ncbi:MAG: hypothetical protein H8M99_02815 [Gloeobacteraceae cyanobacterium ES-bin-144]|nr:hypothetical protein [Verrucomicrobiales bacterium]
MKTLFRNIVASAFAVALVTSASAQSPNRNGPLLTKVYKPAVTQEEIQKLQKGDRYALVCMECKSITVKEIANNKDVDALCHDGGSIHCDSCEKKVFIKHAGKTQACYGEKTLPGRTAGGSRVRATSKRVVTYMGNCSTEANQQQSSCLKETQV